MILKAHSFLLPQYTLELATYFSRIGIYLSKHVVPRNVNDLLGAIFPQSVESQIKQGEGMVGSGGLRLRSNMTERMLNWQNRVFSMCTCLSVRGLKAYHCQHSVGGCPGLSNLEATPFLVSKVSLCARHGAF